MYRVDKMIHILFLCLDDELLPIIVMTAASRLNKPLWTNLTRLKLMDNEKRPVRFVIEQNPFDEFDDEEIPEEKSAYFITGRVYPNSGVYKDIGFDIEMKLTINYPQEAPIVRITSPVYHPNIENDGNFVILRKLSN